MSFSKAGSRRSQGLGLRLVISVCKIFTSLFEDHKAVIMIRGKHAGRLEIGELKCLPVLKWNSTPPPI